MLTALAIVAVVQAIALGAVALRAVWPGTPSENLDHVGGEIVHQDPDEYEDDRLGFRGSEQ